MIIGYGITQRVGEYTVKFGNWLANQSKHHALIQEAEVQPSTNCLREQIWKLKCPAKIKNFLWRTLIGALQVVDKLLTRKVRLDTRCQTCGLEGESINHVLLDVPLQGMIQG